MNRNLILKRVVVFIVFISAVILLFLLAPIFIELFQHRNYLIEAVGSKVKSDLFELKKIAEQYHSKTGHFPAELQVLLKSRDPSSTAKKLPKDPWGKDYLYKIVNRDNVQMIYIWTYGADGIPGGEGLDMDLSTDSDWSFLKK